MANVIDLFSGAGGLSLGAARAGFSVAGSVEVDQFALATHALNFSKCKHLPIDVAQLSGVELLSLVGLQRGELDGLVGGPPCQGFSTMGRRDLLDVRNDLFGHFFRLVNETQPKFFMAENVPGILDPKYDDVRRTALEKLDKRYMLLPPISVKASEFGVPTTRTRIFFLGFDARYFSENLNSEIFFSESEKVYVEQALRGLPVYIDATWQSEESGWRSYKDGAPASFFNDRASGHIPYGVGDVVAIERYQSAGEVWGCMGTKHTPDVIARFAATAQGSIDKISKAKRLDPKGFCPTLRAGTAKDKGSYQAVRPIHYSEPRVITVREAARLQGFPDWFIFHPTKWHSFRQIGNSVSPIVAEKMLRPIYERLL